MYMVFKFQLFQKVENRLAGSKACCADIVLGFPLHSGFRISVFLLLLVLKHISKELSQSTQRSFF